MKKVSLLVIFLLLLTDIFAQSKEELLQYSDSLYRQAQQQKDIYKQAENLLDLSFFWSDYDETKALEYVSEGERLLGEKGKTNYYQGLFRFYRAAISFDIDPLRAKKLYMQADSFLNAGVPIEKQNFATRYRARLWGSYGALLQREGKPHEYVRVLIDKVIPMAKRINDDTLLGNNLQNVALSLMNLGEYGKAEQYYNDALALLNGNKDADEQRLTLLVNAGRNAILSGHTKKARTLLDSAASTLRSVPTSAYLPTYHTVEGSYWEKQRQFDYAQTHFDKALVAAKEQQNPDMIASILFSQSMAYQAAGNHALARKKLREVLPYVQERSLLKNKQQVYYNLAHTARQLGNYKEATGWYEHHKQIMDTLLADKGNALTLELEKKYQTAEKENELLRVNASYQQQELAIQRTRMFAGIFLFISIVLALLSIFWYWSLKNKKKLAAQQEKLNLFNAMLQGQEKERSRIARDLHDGLGGLLASVKLKLSAVANREAKAQPQTTSTMDLYAIINQMDHSVSELRRIARNMMPESLLYMGLEASLRDLCNAMTQQQMHIDFQATNLRMEYKQSFLIAVYRIVQELLTNAIKHSAAAHIWVQCAEEDGYFYIAVEDNGKGFDLQAETVKASGIGLSNIRNRVDILNGKFTMDTAEGKGTSFHIKLKLEE